MAKVTRHLGSYDWLFPKQWMFAPLVPFWAMITFINTFCQNIIGSNHNDFGQGSCNYLTFAPCQAMMNFYQHFVSKDLAWGEIVTSHPCLVASFSVWTQFHTVNNSVNISSENWLKICWHFFGTIWQCIPQNVYTLFEFFIP